MKVLPRLLLWSVAAAVLVVWAFQAGIESYDREHCGPDATDCDLGALSGLAWAALAMLGVLIVVTCVEVWLAGRRRKSQQQVPAGEVHA